MLPEAAEAIRIAEKHCGDQPIEKRKALSLDIQEAIIRHAGKIAADAISKAFEKAKEARRG